MIRVLLCSLFLSLTTCVPVAPYIGPQKPISTTNLESQDGGLTDGPNQQGPTAPTNSGDVAGRTNELPYDFTPDVISSLTCSGNVNLGSGSQSLSVSSRFEGLKLSEDFKKAHNLNDKSPKNEVLHALNQSPLKYATAELAIRFRANLNQIIKTSHPLQSYFPQFNQNSVFNQLSDNQSVTATRPLRRNDVYNSVAFRSLLPSLSGASFLQVGPGLAKSYGNYILTVLYAMPSTKPDSSPSLLRNTQGQFYGKSYTIDFNSSERVDYLSNIYEEDLLNSREGKDWHCPEDLKFMINKNEKSDSSYFNNQAATSYAHLFQSSGRPTEGYCDVNDQRALSRKQKEWLSVEFGSNQNNWPFKVGSTNVWRNGQYVTLDTACIVIPQSKGACYYNGFYRVEFDPDVLLVNGCKRLINLSEAEKQDQSNPNSFRYSICPAWFSICYREEDRNSSP